MDNVTLPGNDEPNEHNPKTIYRFDRFGQKNRIFISLGFIHRSLSKNNRLPILSIIPPPIVSQLHSGLPLAEGWLLR
jgi:hypothetical protein